MTFFVMKVKHNEKGYVMVATLLLLLLLTVIGVAASHTSNVEVQLSGNTKKMVEDFYLSEGALITVLENTDWWLDDVFLSSGEGTAHWVGNVDVDGNGRHDALVEIRCVSSSRSAIATLSAAANRVPVDRHVATPPIDSGYSARHFNAHKYAVTARDLRSGIDLQTGAWKAFNKY